MCLCILCSCRQKSSRVIIFNEFLQALQELAPKRFKGKSHEEAITAIYQLVEAGEPSKSGVTVRKTQDMTTQEPCLEFLLEKLHHFLQWKKNRKSDKKIPASKIFFSKTQKLKKIFENRISQKYQNVNDFPNPNFQKHQNVNDFLNNSKWIWLSRKNKFIFLILKFIFQNTIKNILNKQINK